MTTARRPRNRKELLARAAAELFRQRGYHAVGVKDIAAAAGVTGPAVYRHFENKQDVLAHVVLAGVDTIGAVVDEATSTFADKPEKASRAVLERLAELSVANREITALWRWQGHHLDEANRAELRRRVGSARRAWTRLIIRCRPDITDAEAELLCWASLSVFGSVADHRVSLPRRRFEQLLVELAGAVLAATVPSGVSSPTADEEWRRGSPGATSRREELLTIATTLFRERGFHDVSMEEIGAAAGIAGPSVYRYFPSKADIMLAAAYRMGDRLMVGARRAVATASDPTDALHRIVESYVDITLHPDGVPMRYADELINVPDRDRKELVAVQRGYVAEWVRLLRTVAPWLDEPAARITVQAALTIVNDLPRTRRVNARPGLTAELTALAFTVLATDVSSGTRPPDEEQPGTN
ncbi:TetR family transcriptional regulator [Herbihabitans rhizosphaerae]|uniref:TetR family transcriptional regulator n=1 Tax=Herbihabitans rhizosphaerae TaxID=1872711 RepID=A0A4Q7KII8_9PSEU|nr:TetR family transcriptional regulator [Herbihabitans rhizosphaerae]RZS34404.1 TetR family transcriptional regulator [Herbihabitans rhizosphaerae]